MPDINSLEATLKLRALNKERQTGVPEEVDELEQQSEQMLAEGAQAPSLERPMVPDYGYGTAVNSMLASWGQEGPSVRDYSTEVIQSGYGTSRYDRANPYYPGMDIEDVRAREQSNFAKIGMGLTKMGTTALTTFANTTVGTVFGAFAAGAEAVKQATEGDMSLRGILEAGVSNPVSEWLIGLQQKADEWFPNYRTQEERTEQYQREWYRHMGDANFIGDVFIKNLGFTLGAMAGGMVWSRALAPVIKGASANILKGAVLSAAGDAEATTTMNAAIDAWKAGRMTRMEAEKILKNIKDVGKVLNKADARMQLYGAAISAMGEGSAEGLMAKDEFQREMKEKIDRQYYDEYQRVEQDILDSGDPAYVESYISNIDGRAQEVKRLTPEGEAEVSRRRQAMADKYNEMLRGVSVEGDSLAATTFLLNLPILTASNLVQFGKMFSGGWRTTQGHLRRIGGGVALERAAVTETPKVVSDAVSKGNKVLRTVEKAAKNMVSEASEEMLQGTASSGSKRVAMASFNNDGYDPDAISSYQEWFEQMYQGGAEYLGDIKNWQEGALGALTGLFGVPSFRFQKGQWWSGGIIGAAQEASREIDEEREAVQKLNDLVNSQEFQDNFHSYARLLKYSNMMDDAAEKGDQYAWHTAENLKMVNAVMTFARAGKLNDLLDMVDDYANLTIEDAANMRSAFSEDKAFKAEIDGKSDQEVVDQIKEKAEQLKTTIQDYKDVYDGLSLLAPKNATQSFLEEMTFTAMHLKDYERRFMQMFDETMSTLEKTPELTAMLDAPNPVKTGFENLKTIRTAFESYFGADPTRDIPAAVQASFNASLDMVEKALGKKDSEPRKKIEDMKKIVEDRRALYEKLQRMENPKTQQQAQEEHAKQAITQEKVEKAAEKEYAKEQTEGLNTLSAIRNKYLSFTGPQGNKQREEFRKSLEAVQDNNPAAKQFLAIYNKQSALNGYAEGPDKQFTPVFSIVADPKYGVGPLQIAGTLNQVTFMYNQLYRKAATPDELTDEKNFPTFDEFHKKYPNATQAEYGLALQMAKQFVSGFDQMENDTKAVDNIGKPQEQTPPPPVPGNPTAHSTYDESQPGGEVDDTPAAPKTPVEKPEEKAPESGTQELSPKPERPAVGEYLGDAPVTLREEDEPAAEAPSDKELIMDMAEATGLSTEDAEQDYTDQNSGGQKDHLHTSMPEVDSFQAADARMALARQVPLDYKLFDLSDFVTFERNEDGSFKLDENGNKIPLKNEQFAKSWQALQDRAGFDTLATQVQKGDAVYFIIDRSFPEYDGKYQVLLAVKRGEEYLPFGLLSQKSEDYLGLSDLHTAIDDEFNAQGYDDNGRFVFSMTSTVYKMMPGLIDYGMDDSVDTPVINIPAYDENAPIIMIDKNGHPQALRGTFEFEKLPASYQNAAANRNRGDGGRSRQGHVYYLAQSGNGKYVPIHLNIEHFNHENAVNSEAPTFSRIKDIFKNIANIVHAVDASNVGAQEAKLKTELADLVTYLDLHDIDFELDRVDDSNNLGLRVVRYKKQAQTDKLGIDKENIFYPETITDAALIDFIAELRPSLQIKSGNSVSEDMTEGAGKKAETYQKHFADFISEGLVTSNAKMLRPKGVDVRMLPFDGGAFVAVNDEQRMAMDEDLYEEPEETTGETPDGVTASTPEYYDLVVDSGSDGTDDFEFQVVGSRPSEMPDERLRQQNEKKAEVTLKKSRIYNELLGANGITNMQMSDKKLREKLKRAGLSQPVINFLVSGLKEYPSMRSMTPMEAFTALSRVMSYDIVQEYDKSIKKKIDSRLEDYLADFLSRFNIRVNFADMKKVTGRDDVSGAFSILQKTIWLADNPEKRNELTMPEEFAHAFVELMGSSINYGSDSDDFKFLYNTVSGTDIYKRVYSVYKDIYKDEDGNPDEYRIRKEAIGQALAVALVHNWNERQMGVQEKDRNFWQALKEWFEKIVDLFGGENITFERTLNDIANEVLDGNLSRLEKVNAEGYTLLDYAETIENQNKIDGGKALGFMRYFSKLGNIITGSFAYRKQGTVYRSKLDSLHDIDMIVPAEVHGLHNVELLSKYNFNTRHNSAFFEEVLRTPYFTQIKKDYPKMIFSNVFNTGRYITVNAVYSEDENLSRRFAAMSGSYASRLENFTESERKKLYLFDFFLRTPEANDIYYDEENELTLVDYTTPFREKLAMGRSKDIYDYQMWKTFNSFAGNPSPTDMLFQVASDGEAGIIRQQADEFPRTWPSLDAASAAKRRVSFTEQRPTAKKVLLTKGLTEAEFNRMPDLLKEQTLKCL